MLPVGSSGPEPPATVKGMDESAPGAAAKGPGIAPGGGALGDGRSASGGVPAEPDRRAEYRKAALVGLAGVVVLGGLLALSWRRSEASPVLPFKVRSAEITRSVGDLAEGGLWPAERTVDPYRGYGAWVDVFDFSPAYTRGNPPFTFDNLDEMAADGVRTLYLQAARLDDRTPDGLEDRWLLADLLIGAHERGMAVVAWYLPKWSADGQDLERLRLLDEFEVLGHRFDGIAVDIEWRGQIPAPERSTRLVTLSQTFRSRTDDPLGAIVMPAVLMEVINHNFWPAFPYRRLAPIYDVWLPMSYWSFRTSEYGDGYSYHEESVRRLRANLGDPDALVHGIGGIGGVDGINDPQNPREPRATLGEIDAFMESLVDSGSIGGSIYDWQTLEGPARRALARHFSTGVAANLGQN